MKGKLVKRIENTRLFTIDGVYVTKEMFEGFEEYIEDLVFENLLTAKYFLFHISENQCPMRFLKHGDVCNFTCYYCKYCPFLLKIAPVDDVDKEDLENSEYQVISYCSHNHDKTLFVLEGHCL